MMSPGVNCDYNQTIAGCRPVTAMPAVRQGQFFGKRVCGKQGGLPFLNVTRVNETLVCPEGTLPCTDKTSSDNTICYNATESPLDVCPILSMEFVNNSSLSVLSSGQSSIQFNSTTYIVWSKDVDSLPATTMKVEYNPCMNPEE